MLNYNIDQLIALKFSIKSQILTFQSKNILNQLIPNLLMSYRQKKFINIEPTLVGVKITIRNQQHSQMV